jgi:broad specificity phosphatase PhoE
MEEKVELNERFFGDFEGKSHKHYEDVWKEDGTSSSHKRFNVESVDEVLLRMK